jgi:hypothetical protein
MHFDPASVCTIVDCLHSLWSMPGCVDEPALNLGLLSNNRGSASD